ILQPNDLGLNRGSLFANLAESDGTAHFIVSPAGTLTANVWQHVALTYDKTSGQARLYRNGELVATAQVGSFTPETTYDVYLGRRPAGDGTISYVGLLDEVAIYNRVLAQQEIQAIVSADIAGKCKDPLPPEIVVQPQGELVYLGDSAYLNMAAVGT